MAKILVIDDERAIRNTLKDILEFESYTVDVAENGRIGLEKALSGTYDLIFTDIKMPEMDGIEFLHTYRAGIQQQGEEAPVVVITGHGSVDSAVESLKSGAFDFIQKPLDLNRLLVTMALPMVASMLVQALYNVVDRMFIGNIPGVGPMAITGLGVTLPIMTIILDGKKLAQKITDNIKAEVSNYEKKPKNFLITPLIPIAGILGYILGKIFLGN